MAHRQFRRSRSTNNRYLYRSLRNRATVVIRKAKLSYYRLIYIGHNYAILDL